MTYPDEDEDDATTRPEMARLRQRIAELEHINADLQRQLGERTQELSLFVEKTLRRHDAILEALGFAAERFLQTTLEESIMTVLERLGTAAGVSRVYLFENHRGPDEALRMSQRYEWVASGTVPQIDNPELQNLSYQAGGFARWENVLQQGYSIYGKVSTFPEEERAILEPQDIQSIAVVPIFACQQWWGFIGFDDCEHPHPWSVSEISILRAAATIIGAAIEHEHMQRALRESERKFRWFLSNPTTAWC
ncbi:MAG: GAF domain-containing protein [Chloroflexaceae bacterium]|nr:GAF domain-containing protein [Chloroflexaceae bacterium]